MPAAILNGLFLSHSPQHAVPQHGFSVHAHLQPHIHDAPDRTLVRLPSVPRPNASGLSFQLLGGNQRATGKDIFLLYVLLRILLLMPYVNMSAFFQCSLAGYIN